LPETLIESRMTETILKSSISVLEAFNEVRNNKSLAHDNELLNESERMPLVRDAVASAGSSLVRLQVEIIAKGRRESSSDASTAGRAEGSSSVESTTRSAY
jgi:hypothetical protein